MQREHCPVCASAKTEAFLRRSSVPVHQNVLFTTPRAARAIPRGELEMRACADCSFVYNAAFDNQLVEYGPTYENSQNHSAAFNSYLDDLVEHLVARRNVRSGRLIEVGCGKGVFLQKMLSHPLSSCVATGFDPAYTGPRSALDGRIDFVADFYSPATALPADIVVCRHVIEHIPEPVELLRTIRAAVGESGATRVFFETPCVKWILQNSVSWDFFYEHCSLFTTSSLALAFQRAGFSATAVKHVFGGQYLWAEGTTSVTDIVHAENGTEIVNLARAFAIEERGRLANWDELLGVLSERGQVYAWGAGAKGVTFCNLADPDCTRLAGIVDVNPAKQGKFLPGTGHPIVPPEATSGAAALLFFNPNYLGEVLAAARRFCPAAAVIDPMEAMPCKS